MLRPFGQSDREIGGAGSRFFQGAEKRALALLAVRDHAGRSTERALDLRKQSSARLAKAVARATFDKCFKHFPAHCPAIHSLAEFRQGVKSAAIIAGL